MNEELIKTILFWADKGCNKSLLIKSCVGDGYSELDVKNHIEKLINQDVLTFDIKDQFIIVTAWMPRTASKIKESNKQLNSSSTLV